MIENIIRKIANNAPVPKEDEVYLGEDGFMHCKKCGEARECIPAKSGRFAFKVSCMCKCQAEQVALDKMQLKSDMTKIEIQKARQLAKNDPSFKLHTFANDNGKHPELMRKAKKYADDFQTHMKNSSGLLLCGPKGTGKSYAAEAIANQIIDNGYPVIFTTFGKIAETAMEAGYEGRREYFDSLSRCSLLIIDDVGVERETDYMMETIHRVINERDRSLKPMIITTNFTAEEINHPSTSEWERIWSRIMRTCYPIRCEGNDMRAAAGMVRNKEMKKYFEE